MEGGKGTNSLRNVYWSFIRRWNSLKERAEK